MKKFEKIFKKRLENLLIDGGLINLEIAEHARNIEAETGQLVGDILVNEGYVSEEEIARELARNLQLPYLDLPSYNISKKLVEDFSAEILHKLQVIPVDRFGNTLTMSMSQHLSPDSYREILEKAACEVTFYVSRISHVRDRLKELAPVDESTLEDLRKKKLGRGKPSSWTDIFDTASQGVAPVTGGGDGPVKRKPAGLDIFDTANTKVIQNLKPGDTPKKRPSGPALDIFDTAHRNVLDKMKGKDGEEEKKK